MSTTYDAMRRNSIRKILSVLTIVCYLFSFGVECKTRGTNVVPDDVLLGAASASYQVEGAWEEDGKGENIWDRMTHDHPEKVSDGSNGDLACDSYHKTKEDVALMKALGLQFYRFSISWSRILPSGFPNEINSAGIAYYNELIDELVANDIIPVVTIYHWDLPQPLQDAGGFTNPDIADWMEWFSNIVFENFGDRVPIWLTFNEPKQICQFAYGTGRGAPGIQSSGIADYICHHNLLKAHARVYHLYDDKYRATQNGRIGITFDCGWAEPANATDEEAANRRREFDYGMYANPIFHPDGDYPQVVKEFVAKRSEAEGFPRSRLPEFTQEEIEYIKGTSDYFGINHYVTRYVMDREAEAIGEPSEEKDEQVTLFQDPSWPAGAVAHFRTVPWGLTSLLRHIKFSYNDPDIYITENGYADRGEIDDQDRVAYLKSYLQAVLDAVYYDDVKVKMYAVWSFLDNFAWSSGYSQGFYNFEIKYGLYHVNYTDPERTRTAKASAEVFKDIISTRIVPN